MASAAVAVADKALTLDPYKCIPKRNRKYASECTEVHLANQGAERISEEFSHFTSLEVIWFNGNRLSRIENLENSFRIREVYIEDNRLVSLSGLRAFKFLCVLHASGNQLRNLDKQLAVISKFAFLRKLELFDNPIAEEPDYRLRVIYEAPQVEILDRHAVKGPERIRADEVVPNLDKVSAPKPKPKRRAQEHSVLERRCFRSAAGIRERQQRDEESLFGQTFARSLDPNAGVPRRFLAEFKLDPTKGAHTHPARPTQLERYEMRSLIEKRAGKPALTREDVETLAKDLARDGVDEVGRVLGSADVLRLPPLEKMLENANGSAATGDVANWLLTLEWPRPDHADNDLRVAKAYDEARRAEAAGDADTLAASRNTVLRLTRGHSYVGPPVGGEGLGKAPGPGTVPEAAKSGSVAPKARGDVFKQTFLRPSRGIHGSTGRMAVSAAHEMRSTAMGFAIA